MTAAKRMRRADIVDLKEVQERFEEFDGVAGKGKGGLTEFRCELLNLYFRGPADHHLSKRPPPAPWKRNNRDLFVPGDHILQESGMFFETGMKGK